MWGKSMPHKQYATADLTALRKQVIKCEATE